MRLYHLRPLLPLGAIWVLGTLVAEGRSEKTVSAASPEPAVANKGATVASSSKKPQSPPDPLGLEVYKGIPQRLPLKPLEYFEGRLEANRLSKQKEVNNLVIHSRLFDVILVNPVEWEVEEENEKKRKNKADSICLYYKQNTAVKFSFSLHQKNASFKGIDEATLKGYALNLHQKYGKNDIHFFVAPRYKNAEVPQILSRDYYSISYQITQTALKRNMGYHDYFLELGGKYFLKISLYGDPEALKDPKIQASFTYYLKHMYFKEPSKLKALTRS